MISEHEDEHEDEDTITDLNTDWIDNIENINKEYQEFYVEDINNLSIKIIYLNDNSEITNIIKTKYNLTKPNVLLKEELISILKKYMTEDVDLYQPPKKYSIMSILKINVVLNEETIDELKYFLTQQNENINCLISVKNINNIYFEKTVKMFEDITELIIILYERPIITTKTILINKNKNKNKNKKNKTKKK
jgi:hypothetical protein